MNRRSFFGRFGAAAAVVVAPNAMKAQHAPLRRALQGGMPQCPECLAAIPIIVPRDPETLRNWTAQETHVVYCQRCKLYAVWRTLL